MIKRINAQLVIDVARGNADELGISMDTEDLRKLLVRVVELQTLYTLGLLTPPVSKEEEETEPSEPEKEEVNFVSIRNLPKHGVDARIYIPESIWSKLVSLVGSEYRGIERAIGMAIQDWVRFNNPNHETTEKVTVSLPHPWDGCEGCWSALHRTHSISEGG